MKPRKVFTKIILEHETKNGVYIAPQAVTVASVPFEDCDIANEIMDRLSVFDSNVGEQIIDPKDADLALKVARLEGWKHWKDDYQPKEVR